MLTEINPINYLLNAENRIYLLFLLSSLVIALIFIYFNPKQRRVNFSKKLWLHPSAILDYSYFFVTIFIKVALVIPLIISAQTIIFFTYETLIAWFGFYRLTGFSYVEIITLFTLCTFVFSDFTRYWLHRMMHAIPLLWRFHAVHHSAKVLNPITFYRVHPVESLLFGIRYSLSIGLVAGIFIYLFGTNIDVIEVLGVNVLIFGFNLLGSNLRHSHIPLRYPRLLEKLLISPKQHQMHHAQKYAKKNYGGYLAVWDYLFKTIAYSKCKEKLHFGLNQEIMKKYQNVWQLLKTPFKNS